MSLAHLYLINFGLSALIIVLPFKASAATRNVTAIYLFFLLLATRQFDYKKDLSTYHIYATWSFYTYREPFFYYLNNLTYDVLAWRNIYFLSDTISVLIIRNIFQKLNLNHNYMLIFFCFFPVIMGFQSIYRQFFGTLICLYIISFGYQAPTKDNFYSKRLRGLIQSLLAIGSHNLHILSILVIKFTYFKYLLNFIFSAAIGFAIVFVYDLLGKANQNTGDSTAFLYLITLIILSICFYFNKDRIGLNLSISGATIIAIMWSNGLQTPSERVGLSFLIFVFISLSYFVDRFKPRIVSCLTLLSFGFFPLFLSSAKTLITGSYLYG